MTTSRRSSPSVGVPLSLLLGFPAKTSPTADYGPELLARAAACGPKVLGVFAQYDPLGSSWKTSQLCWDGDLAEFSGTWPRSGMTRNGIAYEQTSSAPHTAAIESGLLPTPSGTSNHGQNHVAGRLDEWGGSSNRWRGTADGKLHLPDFEEWLMGFPALWSVPTRSETRSSHK